MIKKTNLSGKLKKLEDAVKSGSINIIQETPAAQMPAKERIAKKEERIEAINRGVERAEAVRTEQPKTEVKRPEPKIAEAEKPKIIPRAEPEKPRIEQRIEKPRIEQKIEQRREPPKYVEEKYREEGVLKVKEPERIEEKKPEEIIEPLDDAKYRKVYSIRDLAIPEQKLSKLFKIETKYTTDSLIQIFTSWRDPKKVIKWTVKKDDKKDEFNSLKNEGLSKLRENPPVYGIEVDNGALIASHIGSYTFIMGCKNLDLTTLTKLFGYGLENARRFELE